MRNLSISVVLAVCLVAVSTHAKPHGGTKTRAARPHEVTNRMLHSGSDHHHRDRPTELSSAVNNTNPTSNSKVADAQNAGGSPPELQLHHVTEHNIHKNTEDKDGIPMESERLIHVTPKPVKSPKSTKNRKTVGASKNAAKTHGRRNSNPGAVKPHHKNSSSMMGKKKSHHKTNSSAPGKSHHKHPLTAIKTSNIKVKSMGSHAPAGSKSKTHKQIKKYNSKKHGWKKNLRKEKAGDKQKEKRERQEKKVKAMHHGIEKKN